MTLFPNLIVFALIGMVKFLDLYTNSMEWYQKGTKGKFGGYNELLMAFTFANISWLILILLFIYICYCPIYDFIYSLGNGFKNWTKYFL